MAARARRRDPILPALARPREHERGRRLDRHAAARAPSQHDEYRYDPSDPTPYLIDSRELETSLNEDFASLNATRPDELVFTSPPLTQPLLVAGPLSASTLRRN